MASSRGMPVEIRSAKPVIQPQRGDGQHARCRRRRSGRDIRWCRAAQPRYFTTRRRRVAICSVTRWSSRMTQSETYSSRPWRVSAPARARPVMTAVTPLSFSQRNSRRSSARRMARWAGRRTALRACPAPRAWRRWNRSRDPAGRTALPGHTRRSPRSRCARCGRSRRAASSAADQAARDRSRAMRRSASSSAVSSKAMNTPGSPNCARRARGIPWPSSVLPQPAPPQTSVGRPRGSPPPVISSSPWMPLLALGNAETIGTPYPLFDRPFALRLPVSTATTSNSKWCAARPLETTCTPRGGAATRARGLARRRTKSGDRGGPGRL